MALEYEAVGFRNRVVEYPRSYVEETDAGGGVTHTPNPGEVIDPGVLPTAENMNHMDAGIVACVEEINGLIDQLEALAAELSDQSVRIGNNARAISAAQAVNEQQSADIAAVVREHNALAQDEEALENDFNAFAARRDNPNQVTKAQVGLGNVPNVATNDQTPTFTKASAVSAITSGAKLSVTLGILAKDIEALITHINDRSNIHQVTKAQVGLGNVPNVTTNQQTPTYSEAESDAALVSGETLAMAFGKLQRAVGRLYQHIADQENPHAVDYLQVMQEAFYASPVAPDIEGVFIGNGDASITVNGQARTGQIIDLGFAPSLVIIFLTGGAVTPGMSEKNLRTLEEGALGVRVDGCAFIAPGRNFYHNDCGSNMVSAEPELLLNRKHGGAAVYGNGFVVQLGLTTGLRMLNEAGVPYLYRAWR